MTSVFTKAGIYSGGTSNANVLKNDTTRPAGFASRHWTSLVDF
ncbi:MAG: hypothetical protein WCR72_07530 [Bacteroidota bacterium]